MSSYMIFASQMQTQMSNMDKFNGLDFAQKSKIVSESWAQLSE